MKLIIDVSYQDNHAKVVGGFFQNWKDENLINLSQKFVENVEEYIPGQFYKRELPCILEFLNELNLNEIELIIIDGFIYLDDENKKGLGAYLYESLNRQIPIIGVAKSKFHDNNINVREIYRGESKNPLYISSLGIDLSEASDFIRGMNGEFRLPHLIKLVDTETKK